MHTQILVSFYMIHMIKHSPRGTLGNNDHANAFSSFQQRYLTDPHKICRFKTKSQNNPKTMIQATAQNLIKKAPQQAARIQAAARSLSTDSFAFYPVQRNRIRSVAQSPMTRECFSFYPANMIERQVAAPTISNAKAVRASLMKNKKNKSSQKTWEALMQLNATKKIATV